MATDNDAPGSNTCEPLEETTLQQEATSGQEAAQKLAAEYRPTMDLDVLHSWAKDAAAALAAAQTTLEASEQARLQAKNLVKKLRQQAAQEATEAIQANQQNQWDVRKFCQGMESGLLSAASQLEQALGTGQTPEPGRTQNTETSETAQRDRLQGRLRKPMTDTPTTRPAGLPSTPEACRAEQGRVLQRLHGTTPGTWQAISGGYILAKAQSGNEWVCDGGFDSEADLSLAAASPNTHQAYAGLLAEHATLQKWGGAEGL
ncbi:hypothetical protein Deipr_2378 (plasmid) [Deinococcus proteolyticus MRP]|uniref:Uncharacterized protein n=1 Tax=Deinococcus proteolyticus (strain ATCC 35074 / DSM 20540 / JCM 6276 / NBRC 101906 / NCIMB 13154 / VKM Ac-1939 / CCM 2703 / MRP) TaxID=693977 RepID=F0RQE3_DEIPM|nr:hypothetical protein [Deinococcus proteolyticus]ADY27502.1 hypothetical protein Deipr_2378 [Deinococcus proteolyticus MRP]